VGGLILMMLSIKLSKKQAALETEEYEIEYKLEAVLQEEKTTTNSKTKIKTHRAYNEAEKFISEIENERANQTVTSQNKLAETANAIGDANNNKTALTKTKNSTLNTKEISSNSLNKETTSTSNNPNSTNSYRLINRKATFFPNPVYTCTNFGKVVLQIEVNHLGKVTKAMLNKNASTTTNACLIESAKKYAKKARFTTAANKPLQVGSITYIFPGQY